VVIDDPAMAEGLDVPEDKVDPEAGQDSDASNTWMYVAIGVVAVLVIASVACWLMTRKEEEPYTVGQSPSQIHMTERSN
jgi:hypothetical protein